MEENKMEENKPNSKNSDSNLMAALSYIWVLSIVMLIVKKDDEFVKHHARQGLILFLLSFLSWIPVLGQILAVIIILVVILGFIKALSGEKYKIPVIGDIAEKINF